MYIYFFRIIAAHEIGLIQEWLRRHSTINTCPGLEARAAMVILSLENIAVYYCWCRPADCSNNFIYGICVL